MYKIFFQGTVQGVGFRPYIYRKAIENGLVGSVKNIGSGVEVIINDSDFINKLNDLPPLASVTDHTIENIGPAKSNSFSDFSILKSTYSKGETELPADIFMCDDCLNELKDKTNRKRAL